MESPGLDHLPRTLQSLEKGIQEGLHLGAQVYISRDGATVADFGVGESAPGISVTPGTLMLWLSSGKPLTSVAIAQQFERGKLDLNNPVTRFIPEFAQHGKGAIIISHLLTHTAGFRAADEVSEELGICSRRGAYHGMQRGFDIEGTVDTPEIERDRRQDASVQARV